MWLGLSPAAQALPQGGAVVAGEATLTVNQQDMTVRQSTDRAVIDYDSFNVGADERVQFIQPSASSATLNRVIGNDLARIDGQIDANGQVFLINPNGVVFGEGARVDVGGLMVSTLDLANDDFLDQRLNLAGDRGRIANHGQIQAADGVYLVAPEIVNSGEIDAAEVGLVSGRAVLVQPRGSEIAVLADADSLVGNVSQTGSIHADRVLLAVQSGASGSALRNDGLVRAVGASHAGGTIELLAPEAVVINRGELDASALDGRGGEVVVQAEQVDQAGTIRVNGAGSGDGGRVSVLADDGIAMHSGSDIQADAGVEGKGGDAVIIASRGTWFTEDASISARGGSVQGDGGFVEVSGHESVNVAGAVDVGANRGEAGLWYIDPTDITITNTDLNGAFVGTNPAVWTFTGAPATSTINTNSLYNALDTGNVTISTASAAGAAGNVTFATSLNYNGLGTVRTLTINADASIIFQSGVTIADSDTGSAADGLNFVATAGSGFSMVDGNRISAGAGTINITTTAGNATLTGLSSTAAGVDAIRVTASGGSILDAGESNWDFNAPGANARVVLNGRDGISSVEGVFDRLDAQSTNGNILVFENTGFTIDRLAANGTAQVDTGGALTVANGSVLGGGVQLGAATTITIPDVGLSHAGNLRLQAPDLVNSSGGRTLTLGANRLEIATLNTGGALQVNSTVDTLQVINDSANPITVTDANALNVDVLFTSGGALTVNSGAGSDLVVVSDIEMDNVAATINLDAGGDLLVNGDIQDTIGGVSNNTQLNLSATNNVLFANSSRVDAGSGTLTVTATGGNVALGELAGNTINVNAGGAVTDGNGATLNLSANNAVVNAGGAFATPGDSIESQLNSLSLTSGGGAYLSNNRALTLNSLNVNGDLSVILPNSGNLTVTQVAPTVAGSASFTLANGQLRVAGGGLNLAGDLTVDASGGIGDGDSTVSLTANNADLRLGGGATVLNVDFATLALEATNGQTLQISDLDDLNLTNINTSGNLVLATGGGADLTISDTSTVIGGSLTANAAGDLIIADTGLTVGGALNITAQNLRDSDLNVALGATAADIELNDGGSPMTWQTAFDSLALDITGAGALTLTDNNGLTLNAVTTGGAASFTTTGADLVFTSASSVGGDLNLATIGSGDVIVPVAGLTSAGNLTVDADNLSNGGAGLSLTAGTADITLRDGNADANWTTDFDSLVLDIAGTGDLTLVDTDDLAFTINTGGSADISTTNADLTFTAASTVAGDLALRTIGSGEVVVPAAGLASGGNLTIEADNLSDGDTDLDLSAAAAVITLREGNADLNWTTDFDSLVLDIAGTGNLTLVDADDLAFTVNIGGGADISTTGADLVFTSASSVGGDLALATIGSGDVIVPAAGLSSAGNLTIVADNLSNGGAGLSLAAGAADITLRDGNTDANWTTDFDSLALDIAGTGNLTLVDTDDLAFTINTGGSADISTTNADLTFTAASTVAGDLALRTIGSGDVIVPAAGLASGGNLTIEADNLTDGDTDLSLSAADAVINLREGNADLNWATDFDSLVLDIAGTGNLTLVDADDLAFTVNIGGGADISTTGADLVFTSASSVGGDLALATIGSGDVIVPLAGLSSAGNLTIVADNLSNGGAGLSLAAGAADITLRDGNTDANWTTDFDSLVLDIAGTGDLNLVDADDLAFTINTGGSADISTTNADLTFTAASTVAGDLALRTIGSGVVIVPAAGLASGGNLTIEADNLSDGDTDLDVSAADAVITLRDGNADLNWTTDFDSLVLDIAGTGNLTLVDADDLALTVNTGGGVDISTTGADLVFTSASSVGGDLALATIGSGDVIIPAAGLSSAGNLTVNADNLSDGDNDLTLAAADADITLRDGAGNKNWQTSFASLALTIAGAGDLNLTDTDALTLNGLNLDGNASVSATEGDLTLTGAPVVSGDLTLTTVGFGDVLVPAAGLSHSGDLNITADNLSDGDAALSLGAVNADITLRDGGANQNWTTDFATLALNIAGAGDLNLVDADGLTLSSLALGGSASASLTTTGADLVLASAPVVSGDLTLSTLGSGDVIVPAAGLSSAGNLTVNADNLSDGDNDLTLAAADADITLRDGAGNKNWQTSFASLALTIAGAGDLNLTDTDALTLNGLNLDGNASVSATEGNLTLTGAPVVSGDLTLTTVGFGDVLVPAAGLSHSGDLNITADNLSDGDAALSLGAVNADITLRDGGTDQNWTTDFDSLVLSIAGAGDLTLVDADELALALTSAGSADVRTTDADLTWLTGSSVAGDLTLGTLGSGDVIVPASGLDAASDLTVIADDLHDGDTGLNLAGAAAVINLRAASGDKTWQTALDSLALTIAGGGNFNLTDTDALTLNGITLTGDASFATTSGDLALAVSPSVGGDLTLQAAGNLELPVGGLATPAGLFINADSMTAAGLGALSMQAASADIELRNQPADAVWNTAFDSLNARVSGAGLSLTNSRSLRLTGLEVDGNGAITAAGSLTLDANPDVAGDLALQAAGTLFVPATGLAVANQLSIQAAGISDGDTDIRLAATGADIQLTNATTDTRLTTNFATLVLAHAGAGNLTIDNDRTLQVGALASGADLRLNVAGDLQLTSANPAVTGSLALVTSAGGDLLVDDGGLAVTGELIIDANDLRDSDRTVSLAANTADIQLRGLADALTLNTAFASARWDLQGAAVNVNQDGAHQLLAMSASHDFALVTSDDLLLDPSAFNALGNVSFDTGNALLTLANGASLEAAGELLISAADMIGSDGAIALAADRVELDLSQADTLALDLTTPELTLRADSATEVAIANDGDLLLSGIELAAVQDLDFNITGALTVPASGLAAGDRLAIQAADLSDGDRVLSLAATDLLLDLGAPQGDLQLLTQVARADLALADSGSLSVSQTGSLVFADLDNDGRALSLADGSARVALASGDLFVDSDLSARDGTADGVRSGLIELTVNDGNIVVGQTDDVLIQSSSVVDPALLDESAVGVRFELAGIEAEDRSIVLGNGSNNVTVLAEGGDIAMLARAEGTPEGSSRTLVQYEGAQLVAYDLASDLLTGTVTINGVEVEAAPGQLIGAGRRLEMVMDYEFPDDSGYLDEFEDPSPDDLGNEPAPEPDYNSDTQFVQVFGQCNEADDEQEGRCRIEAALKSFLSHWLVGGELPPKTEIR